MTEISRSTKIAGLPSKLEATGTGVTVTGGVTADGLTMGSGEKIILGTGSALQIYHDSATNDSIISEGGSGDLSLRGDNLKLQTADGGQSYIGCFKDSGVVLNYDNATKLTTTDTGITVTGTVTPSVGYKSSDGTSGFTGSASASATLTIKDGLIVAVS